MAEVLMTFLGDRDPYPYWLMKLAIDNTAEYEFLQSVAPTAENVAIQCAAHKRKEKESQGPILSYCEDPTTAPQIIYIYYVVEKDPPTENERLQPKQFIKRVEVIKQLLNNRGIRVEARRLDGEDPTEYVSLLKQMNTHCKDVYNKHPHDEIRALVSPGTPQMQALWYVLRNEGRINGGVWQCIDRANLPAEAKTWVRQLEVKPLFENEAILRALALLKCYEFSAAAIQFNEISHDTFSETRKSVTQFLSELCHFLSNWETGDYKEALRYGLGLSRPSYGSPDTEIGQFIKTAIPQLRQTLGLQGMPKEIVGAITLHWYWKAWRHKEQKRYAECVITCFSAYEGMLRQTLRLVHNERESWDIGESWFVENRFATMPGTTFKIIKFKNGEEKLLHVGCFGTEEYQKLFADENITMQGINKLRVLRNRVAHNQQSVDEIQARNSVQNTQEFIKQFLSCDDGTINKYALSKGSLGELTKLCEVLLRSFM